MKDLVHHMKHVQKKVIASSRKAEMVNNNETKVNNSKDYPEKFPLYAKKKAYESR